MKKSGRKSPAFDARFLENAYHKQSLNPAYQCLEVFVKSEVTSIFWLRLLFTRCLNLLLCAGHDTTLLIVTDTLLKEVCLARERDVLHKIEWVGGMVVFRVAKREQQPVGDELDVLLHECGIHTEKCTWQRVCEEFLLD